MVTMAIRGDILCSGGRTSQCSSFRAQVGISASVSMQNKLGSGWCCPKQQRVD